MALYVVTMHGEHGVTYTLGVFSLEISANIAKEYEELYSDAYFGIVKPCILNEMLE